MLEKNQSTVDHPPDPSTELDYSRLPDTLFKKDSGKLRDIGKSKVVFINGMTRPTAKSEGMVMREIKDEELSDTAVNIVFLYRKKLLKQEKEKSEEKKMTLPKDTQTALKSNLEKQGRTNIFVFDEAHELREGIDGVLKIIKETKQNPKILYLTGTPYKTREDIKKWIKRLGESDDEIDMLFIDTPIDIAIELSKKKNQFVYRHALEFMSHLFSAYLERLNNIVHTQEMYYLPEFRGYTITTIHAKMSDDQIRLYNLAIKKGHGKGKDKDKKTRYCSK